MPKSGCSPFIHPTPTAMTPPAATSTESAATCTTNGSERLVRALAGTVVLTGLGLGWFVNDWFYLLVAFAGLNLLQSAFTGFCPPEIIYNRFRRSS